MKIELDLPEQLVEKLRACSNLRGVSVNDCAAELLVRDAFEDIESLDDRPDWQAAIERSRADLAAGRTVAHEEVQRWHKSQPQSSGPKKQ